MSSKIRIQKVCQNCGVSFIAKTTATRFCSHKCSAQNYKLRAKNKKIEASLDETLQGLITPIQVIATKEYLSVNEASALFNISRSTIYRSLRRNEIPFAKFGKRTLLRKTDFDRIFEKPQSLYKLPERKPITDFYSKEEVLQKYDIKSSWFHKIIRTHNIPKVMINNKLHVSRVHIDRYFEKNRNDMSHINDWYTVQEITKKFQLEPQQIYWRLHEHNIDRKKMGRNTLIAKDQFDQHMQNTNRRN